MSDERRKQIEAAAEYRHMLCNQPFFIEGAEWADANPYRLKKKSGDWGVHVCPQCNEIETSTKNKVCTRCAANPPAPTQDDERDAEEYNRSIDWYDGVTPKGRIINAFLAGRRGYVPASALELAMKYIDEAAEHCAGRDARETKDKIRALLGEK